jgi:DNA-binding NarL/FixJ family response regulator
VPVWGLWLKVFLLDDHELVRAGVKDFLETQDVRLPDGDGVSACREIRSQLPQVACLMLSSSENDQSLFDAVMAGAAGYELKQIHGTDLIGAVRTVASGQSIARVLATHDVPEHLEPQLTRLR